MTAKLSLERIMHNGSPAIMAVIKGKLDDELRSLVVGLGYTLAVDIANRWELVCETADDLNAARNPLRGKVA